MNKLFKLYLLAVEDAIKNYPLDRIPEDYLKIEPSSQVYKDKLVKLGVDFNHLCKYDLESKLNPCLLCGGCNEVYRDH